MQVWWRGVAGPRDGWGLASLLTILGRYKAATITSWAVATAASCLGRLLPWLKDKSIGMPCGFSTNVTTRKERGGVTCSLLQFDTYARWLRSYDAAFDVKARAQVLQDRGAAMTCPVAVY